MKLRWLLSALRAADDDDDDGGWQTREIGLNCLGTEIHYKFYVIDEVNEMDLAKERGGYELELCSVGKELN